MHTKVAFDASLPALSYLVPEHLRASLKVGDCVLAPLHNKILQGYVLHLEHEPKAVDFEIKSIESIDDEQPALSKALIELLLFASRYYGLLEGDLLPALVPPRMKFSQQRYIVTPEGEGDLAHSKLSAAHRETLEVASQHPKGFTVVAVERQAGISRGAARLRIQKCIRAGHLIESRKVSKPRSLKAYALGNFKNIEDLSPALMSVFKDLDATPRPTKFFAQHHKNPRPKLKQLVTLGAALESEIEETRDLVFDESGATAVEHLTGDQSRALAALCAALDTRTFSPALLQGVTGSGKTEVYLRLIDKARERGGSALVLVPEIALTPQLGSRFRQRFGKQVATFHSGLTVAERRDEWERVERGEASIGLGARSALFLPFKKLDVIVIDEEHDGSFKQEENPRYHARDLALVLAKAHDATVVLGSATPSLESLHNAQVGRYAHYRLLERPPGRRLPEVSLIDLCEAERVGEGILSQALFEAINKTLLANEQVILLLNRRGFAPYIYCTDCGHTYRCEQCDVSLTLHRGRDRMMCHYCGFEEAVPETCAACAGHKLRAPGLGTERVEAEILNLFKDVKTIRLDRDTIKRRRDLESRLRAFREGSAQIMIGTQMVAKGHDFPQVTLVGVLHADLGLNFPDFRASERTFQLLTQVAGRAGRGDSMGRVLIQTYAPEHEAVRAAVQHDYDGFAKLELPAREDLGYPPFASMILLRFESEDENRAIQHAHHVAEILSEHCTLGNDLLGPVPAPLRKIRNFYRVQLLLRGDKRQPLHQWLRHVPKCAPGVRQILDVDPVNML